MKIDINMFALASRNIKTVATLDDAENWCLKLSKIKKYGITSVVSNEKFVTLMVSNPAFKKIIVEANHNGALWVEAKRGRYQVAVPGQTGLRGLKTLDELKAAFEFLATVIPVDAHKAVFNSAKKALKARGYTLRENKVSIDHSVEGLDLNGLDVFLHVMDNGDSAFVTYPPKAKPVMFDRVKPKTIVSVPYGESFDAAISSMAANQARYNKSKSPVGNSKSNITARLKVEENIARLREQQEEMNKGFDKKIQALLDSLKPAGM